MLVATRAQLEHRIAVLQSELGARPELVHRAAPHPHPRVRSGVFTKTMTELAGAIHALAGAGGPARATAPSGLHEARRARPAPAQRKSAQAAASRVNSLVKVLEQSEGAELFSAQKIEHQIEQLKAQGAALSDHPSHGRELAQVAAQARRAGAVLSSRLVLQQDQLAAGHGDLMMLKTENCSLAVQFETNLTTLPMIESEDTCTLPNVWDADNGECVESPLGVEGDQPMDCILRGPQSCVCQNWADAHAWKVYAYRKLLRKNFEFRYEEEYGKLTSGGQRQDEYDGYQGSYRKNIFRGGSRNPLTKWGKPIPQRFPHKSGADLGDNWISGFSDRHKGGYAPYEEDLSDELSDHMALSPSLVLARLSPFVRLCLGDRQTRADGLPPHSIPNCPPFNLCLTTSRVRVHSRILSLSRAAFVQPQSAAHTLTRCLCVSLPPSLSSSRPPPARLSARPFPLCLSGA